MKIIIENLKKTFGEKVAVDIERYEIKDGEMLGLVGNNGAGKSTLFRLMLDLIKADSGRVLMQPSPEEMADGLAKSDVDVSTTEDWKDWTGAFVDESFLIDYLTPDEYFQFLGRISGRKQEDVDAFLQEFGHFMAGEVAGQKKLIRNLSAGNKQKVGIVGAMLLQPKVLILDEPFNFLDPSSQNAIKHLLQDYNRKTGATILVSSHNLQHTVDICPRIALLEHGVIIRDIENANGEATAELQNYFELLYAVIRVYARPLHIRIHTLRGRHPHNRRAPAGAEDHYRADARRGLLPSGRNGEDGHGRQLQRVPHPDTAGGKAPPAHHRRRFGHAEVLPLHLSESRSPPWPRTLHLHLVSKDHLPDGYAHPPHRPARRF